MRFVIPLLAAAATLLAAIPSAAQPDELRLRLWQLQAIEYPGGVREMPWPSFTPAIYFRNDPADGDSTLLNVSIAGGCNVMHGRYRITSDSTLVILGGSTSLYGCGAPMYFESVYHYRATQMRCFDVDGDRMRLWSADSSIILHYGVKAPTVYGHRVQLVNLIRGTRRLELFAGDAAHSLEQSDTFARASRSHFLERSTRRFAIAFKDSGFATRFFDTTLPEGNRSLLFVAVTDTSGAPRIMVLDRAQADSAGVHSVVRAVHASPHLGEVLMRIERRGGVPVGAQRVLRFGDATTPEPTQEEYLRLRLAIAGSSAFPGFRIGQVRAGSVATQFLLGSIEGGDLEVWRFDDRAWEPRSLQRALPSPSHIAGRYVSLDDEEVSVSMQTVPEQRLAPMSATAIDHDFDEAGGITVRRWDGSRLDSLGMHIHAGRLVTIISYHGLPRWSTEHLPPQSESVSQDSTVLRVVYASSEARFVWVEAADRTLEVGKVIGQAELRLRAGGTRITVMRPGTADTPRVSFAVPLQGGAAVTAIVTERGDSVAAYLLVDTDPRAQIPMPSLRVVPTVTPPVRMPDDSSGHLLLVNAARGDDELVHTRFYVTTRVRPGETGRRDFGYPPGPNNGSIAVARSGDSSLRVLAPNVAVARDTTTIVVTVGFEPSSPWRLLAFNTPITRSVGDTAPRLRIVGAVDDLPAIDVIAGPGPRQLVEQRIIRDEWTASLPASSGPVRIDVVTPAGEPIFSAHDTLHPGHRYTAILAGVRRYPIVFLLDDDADNGPMRRSLITLPAPTGVADGHLDDAPHVAPNPASGTLVVRDDGRSNAISIVDDLGRVVLRETLRGDVHLVDVGGIPSGGYTVIASGLEGITWTERVIVR